MKIGIVDYGCGNLFSLIGSLRAVGAQAVVSSDGDELSRCDKIVLPGVGAFGDAMEKLVQTGLLDAVKSLARNKYLLGICLGMQLLFDKSFEYGEHDGLGLIRGEVVPLERVVGARVKTPQMGWNEIRIVKPSPLFEYTTAGEYVYFVHSYCAVGCEDSIAAVTDYEGSVTAAVERNNVFGTQFHPEKSGEAGLKILKAFTELK